MGFCQVGSNEYTNNLKILVMKTKMEMLIDLKGKLIYAYENSLGVCIYIEKPIENQIEIMIEDVGEDMIKIKYLGESEKIKYIPLGRINEINY